MTARSTAVSETRGPAAGPATGGVQDERPLRADAARNRARILRAAGEVFAERGLDATLDDIAAHAGVGTGTVYRRFADREAIIEAHFAERMAETVAFAERCAADPDPWRGLTTLIRTTGAELSGDRGMRQVMTGSSFGIHHVAEARNRLVPLTQQLVARAQAAGALRPEVSATDIPLIFLMIGAVADYAGEVAPALWSRYVAFLLDGIRASPERSVDPTGELPAALAIPELTEAMSAWRPPALRGGGRVTGRP